MGIKGLLSVVKPIISRKPIAKYSASRIGIDGHSWMHQILPSIAYEVYNNIETNRHTKLFIGKLKSLMVHNITPIVVFDGDYLSSKEKTCQERRALRERYSKEVEHYLQQKDTAKARELMKRCVTVTRSILMEVLEALRSIGIEYILSPYEADAQLHFLEKIGYIDYILTEDSDLIIYGSKKILYKYTGTHVEEYSADLLWKCKDRFFAERILEIGILSGCDYLDSIKGIGIAKAHKILKEALSLENFVQSAALKGMEVPEGYLDAFLRAKLTFMHHIVYNPLSGARQYLNETADDLGFLGTLENQSFAVANKFGGICELCRHYLPCFLPDGLENVKNTNEKLLFADVNEK